MPTTAAVIFHERERMRNVSRAFTLFRELSRQPPTKSLANHRTPIAHPSLTLPGPLFVPPKDSCHAPALSHTRIFQVGGRSTRLSRARLYYRGMQVACRWHAFVAAKSGRSMAMKFERDIESSAYTPYFIVELDQICILAMINTKSTRDD